TALKTSAARSCSSTEVFGLRGLPYCVRLGPRRSATVLAGCCMNVVRGNRLLNLLEELVVLGMRSDPEPVVILAHGEGSVVDAYPWRIGGALGADLLEVEAGIGRVSTEVLIGLVRQLLHVLRELFEERPKLLGTLRLHERKVSPAISSVSPAASSARASVTS